MKLNLQILKRFWSSLRKHWTRHFQFIVRDERTLSDIFQIRLTPRKIVVLAVSVSMVLVFITAMLIAFTPLRVYVPGYTSPAEYKLYRKTLVRVDSLERVMAQNKTYLDNFYNVLNDIVISEEMTAEMEGTADKRTKNTKQLEQAKQEVESQVQLLLEVADRNAKSNISLSQRINAPTLTIVMPTLGLIKEQFSIPNLHFGVDIQNEKGMLITSVADGTVIYSEFSQYEGNVIMIQHDGSVISIYKNNDKLFKSVGAKVRAGELIATMGNVSKEHSFPFLHFELWYNGVPINPLQFLLNH